MTPDETLMQQALEALDRSAMHDIGPLRDALRDRLERPVVPPAWKLVPMDPTPEMRQDGHRAWMRATLAALEADPGPEEDGPHSNIAAAYRAMLAAAHRIGGAARPAVPQAEPVADPAPPHSLPDWDECALQVCNV